MKPSETLNAAADLITPEGAWGQHGYASVNGNYGVTPYNSEANCFCMMGALWKVSEIGDSWTGSLDDAIGKPFHFLTATVQKISRNKWMDVEPWNDAPRRTQAQAIRALRKAAKLAQEAGE